MTAANQTTALAVLLSLFAAVSCWAQDAGGDDEGILQTADVGLPPVYPANSFIGRQLPGFTSYALLPYTNYENFDHPYTTSRRTFFGPLGDRLIHGYDVAWWRESKTSQESRSEIFKREKRYRFIFNNTMLANDSYGGWSATAIFGNEIRTIFTPLTLYKSGFNGFRGDWTNDKTQISIVGSRVSDPIYGSKNDGSPTGLSEDSHPTLLWGARAQRSIGALNFGANFVNMHTENPQSGDRSLKGAFPYTRESAKWLAVQIADDTPKDGRGGPQVFDFAIWINGERRDDIRADVVLHHTTATAVGRTGSLTGKFMPSSYAATKPRGVGGEWSSKFNVYDLIDQPYNIPLFADYFYLKDHNSGVDVSRQANVERLTSSFELLSGKVHRADGEDFLIYYFDLRNIEEVEEVELGFLVGNDYRISISDIAQQKAIGNYETRYGAEMLRLIERAPGNVQNLSNVRWVHFKYGWPTGLSVYSADVQADFMGWRLSGEYAVSREFNRYPNETLDGRRSMRRGRAWYLTSTRESERWGLGGELFSMHPDYTTHLMSHMPFGVGSHYLQQGFHYETALWMLVQDNDDHDRYEDVSYGMVTPDISTMTADPDGVFPGKDEDGDGIPDTNRNFNQIPDYREPFFMFDTESDNYVYDVDLNNNDVPDGREDDLKLEYPYDLDLEGVHLTGWVEPVSGLRLGLGRLRSEQIAGGRENRIDYLRLNYHLQQPGLGEIQFENTTKRVQDDIPDHTIRVEDTASHSYGRGYEDQFFQQMIVDDLSYRNSLVNRSFVRTRLTAFRHLQMVNQVKLEINNQFTTLFEDGDFQKDDRIRLLAGVHKTSYVWQRGSVTVTPQFKLLYLRQDRSSLGIPLVHESEIIPILKVRLRLTERTSIKGGMQGLPIDVLAYRFTDFTNERNSFRRWDWTLFVSNLSEYFGYDMTVQTGLAYGKFELVDKYQAQQRNLSITSMFMRVLLGF